MHQQLHLSFILLFITLIDAPQPHHSQHPKETQIDICGNNATGQNVILVLITDSNPETLLMNYNTPRNQREGHNNY